LIFRLRTSPCRGEASILGCFRGLTRHTLRRGKADDCAAVRRAAAALCATPRSTLVAPVPRPVHGHTLRLCLAYRHPRGLYVVARRGASAADSRSEQLCSHTWGAAPGAVSPVGDLPLPRAARRMMYCANLLGLPTYSTKIVWRGSSSVALCEESIHVTSLQCVVRLRDGSQDIAPCLLSPQRRSWPRTSPSTQTSLHHTRVCRHPSAVRADCALAYGTPDSNSGARRTCRDAHMQRRRRPHSTAPRRRQEASAASSAASPRPRRPR
jgi:hypothetical protein